MSKCVWALVDEDVTKLVQNKQELHEREWLFILTDHWKHKDFDESSCEIVGDLPSMIW